ncbi:MULTISPECIES: N-6 DNA methylase [Citrobacter]|uniref:N-6 DNA methylase n=2 Tax=Enterobacteriaceae TaxID=543 RepID=A0A8I0GAB6_CITBR|nr:MULTISPECIES: N-6 DNA methylase [Citrobacter]MBD3126144.1 N-6 DNA methylase [Citrobacter braakii]MDM2754896.1 SAM-dependent methyltransferase [Citrobacter sp. Cpo221]PPS48323.1 N-6 DNA methylase [Citrobacter braakii]
MSQLDFESLFMTEPAAVPVTEPASLPRMISPEEARRQFISVFRHTAPDMRRLEVFRDFISLAARELDMARIRTPENVEESRRICDRYKPGDLSDFKQLFCLMVTALEGKFQDFLGSLLMELELGAAEMAQFFTPYDLQLMMAKMLSQDMPDVVARQGWVTLDEPACGGAGMVIAWAQCMLEAGLNPSEQLYSRCTDIDPMVADIAFVQLSLLGIPAEVITGNTLTLQVNCVRYTPVYYLNNWADRLAFRSRIDAMRKFMARAAA